jgi:hypothetical protein
MGSTGDRFAAALGGGPVQIADPLEPARSALVIGSPAENWIEGPIPEERRASRKAAERGGVDPCNTADPEFGAYHPWRRVSATGQVLIPKSGVLLEDGRYDLVIHFHGHELARKEFVRADLPFVLLAISRRQGVGYPALVGAHDALDRLLAAVVQVVREREPAAASVRHVALTAWSGGYEPIGLLLSHPSAPRIDSVVLLDGLHAAKKLSVAREQLLPFERFARRAADGQAFMFVSHSSIEPDGYASTTRTAHQLIGALGARPTLVRREDRLGMQLVELFSRGGFHVRGYAGGKEMDHCAHLALLPLALQNVAQRWARASATRR